jgi:hypothetical protein
LKIDKPRREPGQQSRIAGVLDRPDVRDPFLLDAQKNRLSRIVSSRGNLHDDASPKKKND